jgi:hypothetical protein
MWLLIGLLILVALADWIDRWGNRVVAAFRTVRLRYQPPSNIEWQTVASLRDFHFPPTVDRDASWEEIQGRKVQWTGKVVSVQGSALPRVHVRMDPRAGYSRIKCYDLVLSVRDTQRSRTGLLAEGDVVTFTGVITEQKWNGSSVALDDVELILCIPSEDSVSEMDWAALDEAMSFEKTALQREQEWNRLVAKRVQWSGVIRSVFDDTIVIEATETKKTFPEVWLSPKPGIDGTQLLALNKGDPVTFAGTLTGNHSDLKLRLKDAEIVGISVHEDGIQPERPPQN